MPTLNTKQEIDAIEKELKASRRRKPPGTEPIRRKTPRKDLTPNNLTPEQEAYCRGRALGMSKSEALAMAGIASVNKSAEFERIPAVTNRIAELAEALTQNSIIKTGLDQGWVISRLMTITERCMQAEPVMGKDGEPSGEYKFDSAGANRALELLGKTLRMFEPKPVTKESELATLSDDDIARIVGELAIETGIATTLAGAQASAGPQQVIEVQAISKAG